MDNSVRKMFDDTIEYQDQLIWVAPVCDFFGFHKKNAYQKIKKHPILGNLVQKNAPDLGLIDTNGSIFLTKNGFAIWIASLNANIVNERLRDAFRKYQRFILDYMFGSMEERSTAVSSNKRLLKLERLKRIITSEIKLEKKKIDRFVTGQLQLGF